MLFSYKSINKYIKMKFNRILEQYVKESEALTKIMLKVDPANSVNRDYRDLDGYEGYILKESDNIWSVLFENIDIPIMDVPFSVIQVVDIPCDETFNSVKLLGLKAIEERKGLTMEVISKIQACNSVDFLEQYLKEEGLNDSEIKDVYKKALLSGTVNESILKGVGTGFKVAKTILQPDYAVAGLINKGIEKYRGKKAEIAGNIKNTLGFGAKNTSQDQNRDKNKPQNKTGSLTAPPREIASRVDSAAVVPYPNNSSLIGYFRSGNVSDKFKAYKNNNSWYLHNTVTDDIFKLTSDPANTRSSQVQIGNRISAPVDPTKAAAYFNGNAFANEMSSNINNMSFIGKSLASIA
jgi:hypothetical protein